MPRERSLADIFQLGYYWETKILLTAVKLDVFSALHDSALPASEIARQLQLDGRRLAFLLNALVAMRILVKENDCFSNTRVARTYLDRSSSEYVGHLLLLHDAEWNNWGQLEETIRTGRSPVRRHVFETDPDMAANVLAVLHRIGRESGPELARRLELHGAKRLLDVGGGAGTNAIAFCREYPNLTATVFDLPKTLTVTKRMVEEAGLTDRIALQPGDFHADSFDGMYDIALMSDILHYQNAAQNLALIRKVHYHLVDGGRLVIKDRFLDTSGTSPAWTTAFAVHIMVNTEHGQCYTAREVKQWMEEAGFQSVVELETCAVVQGTKRLKGEHPKYG
ncbi:MAG: methyltransferase domain-containing protein [Nitrospirae bacterium]|nr:MAG: methyltransferase domain-containing protein [Nitrospirota bacterium]